MPRTGHAKGFERYDENTRRWYDVYTSRVGDLDSRQVAIVLKDVSERNERR